MRAQNSNTQGGSQRKTAWRAGPGVATSCSKSLCLWEALEMFTLQGGVGTAQLLVTSGPGHWGGGAGVSTGLSLAASVCYHRLEAFPTAHAPALQAQDTATSCWIQQSAGPALRGGLARGGSAGLSWRLLKSGSLGCPRVRPVHLGLGPRTVRMVLLLPRCDAFK